MKRNINWKWFGLGMAVLVLVLSMGGMALSGLRQIGCPFTACQGQGQGLLKEHLLSKVDYTMQELHLSPGQQTRYTAVRTKMGTALDKAVERHSAIRDRVKAELDKPEPDVKAIAETLREGIHAMPASVDTQIDYLLEVYGILDPAQQKELTAMIKEHADKRSRHF